MHKILKQGVSEQDVKIYDLYLQRTLKEYDVIEERGIDESSIIRQGEHR